MEMSDEMIKKLKEDFPPEALSKDTSRGFELTSIKAAFVIERLNDVFGVLGWECDFTDPVLEDGEYTTKVNLIIFDEEHNPFHKIKQCGGKKIVKNNVTDAKKSAITDGLTKCASILGIGHRVFKGQMTGSKTTVKKEEPRKETPNQEAKKMIDIVADLASTKFEDPDKFKVWRVDNGLVENLKESNDFDLSRVLMRLKEIK